MALSAPQERFPEPDGPITIFVPMSVGGTRLAFDYADLLTMGVDELDRVAREEGVTLTGKPRFTVVTLPATGDRFLMGQQDWV